MIRLAPLDIDKLRNLVIDAQENIEELKKLTNLKLEDFKSDKKNYALMEHYLRRSLEDILTIGTHILSRLPAKTKDYQTVILSLGKNGIIPEDFAERNRKLAGYRNRLVHVYWEVSQEEIYQTTKQHLDDLDKFCEYFQKVIQDPKKFNINLN